MYGIVARAITGLPGALELLNCSKIFFFPLNWRTSIRYANSPNYQFLWWVFNHEIVSCRWMNVPSLGHFVSSTDMQTEPTDNLWNTHSFFFSASYCLLTEIFRDIFWTSSSSVIPKYSGKKIVEKWSGKWNHEYVDWWRHLSVGSDCVVFGHKPCRDIGSLFCLTTLVIFRHFSGALAVGRIRRGLR